MGCPRSRTPRESSSGASPTCTAPSSPRPPSRPWRREIARRVPMDDARLYLVSGGSEATETAIKLTRTVQLTRGAAGRYKVDLSLAVLSRRTRWARWRSPVGPDCSGQFAPMMASYPHVPAPYPYRCTLRGCGDVCSLACAEALDRPHPRRGPGFGVRLHRGAGGRRLRGRRGPAARLLRDGARDLRPSRRAPSSPTR